MRLLTPPGVFAPISDSRFLADVLREQTLPPRASLLDLCCGSGILAITAAMRGARSVTAVDRSRRAVLTTRLNARLNGVRVKALRGDLFEPVGDQRFDAIVSNPPYVPAETDELPASGPERAWEAGADGRVILDRIIEEAPQHLRPGGFLLLVSSSILGTDRTVAAMRDAGLDDAECVARRRGPLGPLMQSRVHLLEERGMIAPGQREEDVIIVRGRLPERPGWRPPTDAELAASA
ncbi:MAG TPA: HemK2/MTQ2 family protein methyltransferase [Solirubrobacteraceae bacterium]|nr:HemK2/MTQ2 family protein methyltransferase [Solirubrobacteraceae bacterium]